jgi:TM2 domain-containing membrane protein YozV
MTELNLGGRSVPPAPPTEKPARKRSRALSVMVAALLSLLLPGMGQLYVRKIRGGIALALVVVAIDALVVEFGYS